MAGGEGAAATVMESPGILRNGEGIVLREDGRCMGEASGAIFGLLARGVSDEWSASFPLKRDIFEGALGSPPSLAFHARLLGELWGRERGAVQ